MKVHYSIAGLAICLGVNALAAPATLKGKVENLTTGKPAAGDSVVLMSVDKTLTEVARGKTDPAGGFQFAAADSKASHLVRVLHQGVAYDKVAPAGASSVDLQVLDVARELEGVSVTWDVQRLQSDGDTLQVIEEISVRNASNPPRTLLNERPVEFLLPAEAVVSGGKIQISGAQPFVRKPMATAEKGRYYFPFALPPGESRFAVAYRLPYRGEAVIEPHVLYSLEQFVVAVPKSMKFEEETPGTFHPIVNETWANVQQAVAVMPGQALAFRISGTGALPERKNEPQQARGAVFRPASGWLLGGLAVLAAASAAGLLLRKRKQQRSPSELEYVGVG